MAKCNRQSTVLIALALSGAGAWATVPDSILRHVQHEEYGYISNIRQGSANPTSLAATPLSRLALVKAGYDWQRGDYHSPDAGHGTDGFFVEAYGLRRTSKLVFEGVFSYRNENERDKQWNSTLYQSPLNPFVLADSLPSDYNKEKFHIAGRVSWNVSPRLRFGLNADYHVGVQSDETDPRLEAKGMRFILNPGVEYDCGVASIGLTAGINLLNETEQYSSLNSTVTHRFFLMGGLGTFYPQSGTAYNRDLKGTSWFAEPSVKFRIGSRSSDFLRLRFDSYSESATDGGSTYRFLGGDWSDKCFRLYNRFSIFRGIYSHNFELHGRYDDSKGIWYDQRAVSENGTTRYEVVNSSVKHKQTVVQASLGYRLDRLDSSMTPTFTAAVTAGFESVSATNYPEYYIRKTSHAVAVAMAMKRWTLGKVVLRVHADASYRAGLSSSINSQGLELYKKYSFPMYVWQASSSLRAQGRIIVDIPVRKMILGAEAYGGSLICTDGVSSIYHGKTSEFAGGSLRLYF